MGYLIVAGVAVMLTVVWVGWSGLLGLLLVMVLFGLISIPMQRKDPMEAFGYGAVIAAIIHCVVLTVCFAGFGASTEVFWIVYIAALAASTLIFRKETKGLEENAKEPLKRLCDVVEDFSHFATYCPRRMNVFWDGTSKCVAVELTLSDNAYVVKETYRCYEECKKMGVDDLEYVRKRTFEEYVPTAVGEATCYALIRSGIEKFGRDTLTYRWNLTEKNVMSILYMEMQKRYPDALGKGGTHRSFILYFAEKK